MSPSGQTTVAIGGQSYVAVSATGPAAPCALRVDSSSGIALASGTMALSYVRWAHLLGFSGHAENRKPGRLCDRGVGILSSPRHSTPSARNVQGIVARSQVD